MLLLLYKQYRLNCELLMDCPKCKSPYGRTSHVPLLLVGCGHSLCDVCAAALFSQNSIVCPECKAVSAAESVTQLPKNMALLLMSQVPRAPLSADVHDICSAHQKKLEGFCEDEKKLLCINCILLDGHKSHEISPITKAAAAERRRLAEATSETQLVEEKLRTLLSDVVSFRLRLTESANAKRVQVATVYKEIVGVIQERESALRRDIATVLEKEEDSLDKRTRSIETQLKTIEQFRESAERSHRELECELLQKSDSRAKQAADANTPVISPAFAIGFPEVHKETELTILWKTLCPALMMTTAAKPVPAKTKTKKPATPGSGTKGGPQKLPQKSQPQKPRKGTVRGDRAKAKTPGSDGVHSTLDRLVNQGSVIKSESRPKPTPKASVSIQKINVSLAGVAAPTAPQGKSKEEALALGEEAVAAEQETGLRPIHIADIFATLRERREKHKGGRLAEALSAGGSSSGGSDQMEKEGTPKTAKAQEEEKIQRPSVAPLLPLFPQVAPVPSETGENDKISLSTMLERLNEYIYVFCILSS